MTGFLVFVIFCLCCSILSEVKKFNHKDKKKDKEYPIIQEILPTFIGKKCEITVKDAMFLIDVVYSVSGVIQDMDDEWVLIETVQFKKTVIKMLRLSLIKDVKELKEKQSS